MTPNVECEEGQRLNVEDELPVGIHQSRRILPNELPPAQAWLETEVDRFGGNTNSPGEEKRLLSPVNLSPPKSSKSRLQAGLTLSVRGVNKRNKYPLVPSLGKLKRKSKYETTKEKLLAVIRPPYFIISIIIILVSMHMWISEEVRVWFEWSPDGWWREPWRVITYGFVHASASHLALNAVVGLAVGWQLEHEQSWWRVLCVWFGGVVAGALGAGLLQPHVRVVGSSAAVYALLTAHLPNVCLKFGHIPLWWFRPLSVVVLGTSEGCWALMRGPLATDAPNSHVAWSAHALGAAIGLPLAFVVFKGEKSNETKKYIRIARVISAVLLAAGVMLSAFCYISLNTS